MTTLNHIKEEKHTAQSVAFVVELPEQSKASAEDPQIKKRLEAEVPSHITLE